ncbi:MAG: hypothetical protein HKN79_03895 [Flavobacteriales bacterium]|nr:hypothetical protein [Flavobacteriales bacterium]
MAKADETAAKNTKTLYGIIGVLSVLVVVLGVLLIMQRGENTDLTENNDTLTVERNDLQEELGSMLEQYDALTVENEDMNAEMLEQKEEITRLMERVNKLNKDDRNLRWEIDKLKKEARTLRDIMKGYLVKIDSLNQANAALTEENTTLSTNLTEVTSRKNELESTVENQENLIKQGSALTAVDLSASGLRIKSSGKQAETNRASRAEMIRTCVSLGENRITESGKKTLHVRIISPEGVVLEDDDYPNATFEFEGISGKYSTRRDIEYNNEPQDICVFYTVNSELSTGQYIVELYESGFMVGKTSFDLR